LLWFLRDYPLAAVLLRAASLAFAALLIGGIFFCSALLPRLLAAGRFSAKAHRLMCVAAIGLISAQACFVALDSAMLIGTSGLRLRDLYTANYFLSGALFILTSIAILIFGRSVSAGRPTWILLIAPLLMAMVWTSHSTSRLEYRLPLMALTGLHQLAAAIWIGGMPYLWLLIGAQNETDGADDDKSRAMLEVVRRYSTTALASVFILVVAGLGMAWLYTQSWSAVYGTAYGVVLLAKSIMLVVLLAIGASNFLLIRNGKLRVPHALARVARFSEVEIGIGFTIILAAASLTSQPPAVDMVQNRLTLSEIAARMEPRLPRFHTPSIAALPPVDLMHSAIQKYALSPDDTGAANNRVEQAWSEYNHHWAGLVVLLAGLLALLSCSERSRWARHWPLIFLGLAAFLFFRADPEAWPLGPRGFWNSFYNPEELEHRFYVLLILSFVAFEWGVQTRRVLSRNAALVFPAVCAIGGAFLLTHNHTLGNVKEELLTEMSHTAIAILAVFAGWSRWLEVSTSQDTSGRARRIASAVWPACLMLIGFVLLNYRES
jgi:copper resistance protein D